MSFYGFGTGHTVADLAAATGTLSGDIASDATNGESVIIGGFTYTFQTTLSGTGGVKIGATFADTLDNLVAAINGSGTTGTNYGSSMAEAVPNKTVRASRAALVVTFTARVKGHTGNYIPLDENDTNLTASGSVLSGGDGNPGEVLSRLKSTGQMNSEALRVLDAVIG